jgi:hypothetical protein
MIDIVIAASLSETLALNYIKEKAGLIATSVCIGGAAYLASKLLDEHIINKKK